ncbi:MAG TPA: transglycosylase SLT domain-containing protein [Rhizomicrobium sp.]|nr:transglycosylase SLT domain-containing protein [Rhizomicrobium sp.]
MLAEAANSTADKAQIISVLKQASAATGSDFHYLLGTAMRESSLKPQAQSSTSSACGLFQFTGQTWLGMVKETGAKYGLGSYANAITQDGDGHFKVANDADRQAILALRKDPKVASLMAGEFANKTKATLEGSLGRNVCDGELYAAHFLGPQAACKLIQMSARNPNASAADAFPAAADANRSVFYHADGSAKTVRDVYNWALKQPESGDKAIPVQTARAATHSLVSNASASDMDTSSMLSSVLNWTPHLSSMSFGNDDDDGDTSTVPSTPFLLTPGVMDVLSSVAQVAPSHR